MNSLAYLYLACILAGLALVNLPAAAFISGLGSFFDIVGILSIIIFSFAILYLGIRALIKK